MTWFLILAAALFVIGDLTRSGNMDSATTMLGVVMVRLSQFIIVVLLIISIVGGVVNKT